MEGWAFWTVAVMAAMLVGMGKGGIPMVGMLSVPVAALVISPVTAAGLLLPVYVISDMAGLYAYRRAFDRRVLAIVVPGAVVGILFGWATASYVSDAVVTVLVGLIGVVFSLNLLARRGPPPEARRADVAPGLFWGALAGFTSFVSHSGGPPYQVYVRPLQLEKAVFAGTSTIAFAAINAVKLIPYWALGQLSLSNLEIAAILSLPAVVAVFLGVWLVKVLPDRLFFAFVTWTLLLISLKLIWDGSRDLGWI